MVRISLASKAPPVGAERPARGALITGMGTERVGALDPGFRTKVRLEGWTGDPATTLGLWFPFPR